MAPQLVRRLAVIFVLALVLGMAGGVSAHPMDFAQTAPMTWTVLVGGQSEMQPQDMGPMGTWQMMRFYPENITVNVGDTVLWKLNSGEIHTITFPKMGVKSPDLMVMEGSGNAQRVLFNPMAMLPQGGPAFDGTALAGSGQLGGGQPFPTEWKLSFTKPGTYEYFCTLHPMMMGKVIVQAAGASYPKTQTQVAADAKVQLGADAAAAQKAEASIKAPSSDRRPDGTSVFQIQIGYGDGILTYMRFNPTDLTIHVGDTVQWVQNDPMAPHTVTFVSSDAKEPELVLPEPQKAGPPKLVLNPEAIGPVGTATYSGKSLFNSGIMWGTKDPTPGPRSYSLTFDTPGTFKYICALHDYMGMGGQITVLPRGTQS
jgi:plastocyanin